MLTNSKQEREEKLNSHCSVIALTFHFHVSVIMYVTHPNTGKNLNAAVKQAQLLDLLVIALESSAKAL